MKSTLRHFAKPTLPAPPREPSAERSTRREIFPDTTLPLAAWLTATC